MNKTKLWMLAAILVICGATVLTSCSNDDDPVTPPTDEVGAQLQKMTLREKVGQLFYVRPECLDTTIHFNLVSTVDNSADDIKKIKLQAVNATMLGVNEKYPVGGIILYAHNIEDEAQLLCGEHRHPEPLLCLCAEAGWWPGRTLSDIRRAEWLPTWQHDNRQETVRTGSETII